jgi:phosphosulfolactate synthase
MGIVERPDFLDLPERRDKPLGVGARKQPRRQGLTCAVDGGLPLAEVAALLDAGGPYLDVWKLGWGTAYIDPRLDEKLELLRHEAITACPGGTLLEIAARQGRAEECLAWMGRVGFRAVEVSEGMGPLVGPSKAELIRRAAVDFTVFAEVGAKDPSVRVEARAWARAALADLEAGASWVIAEGRESGTVGIYGPDGTVRAAVVEALVAAAGLDRIIFEAPRKDQQAWFIRTLGPDVNLANIAPREALGLEALRLGLRADTAAPAGRMALTAPEACGRWRT